MQPVTPAPFYHREIPAHPFFSFHDRIVLDFVTVITYATKQAARSIVREFLSRFRFACARGHRRVAAALTTVAPATRHFIFANNDRSKLGILNSTTYILATLLFLRKRLISRNISRKKIVFLYTLCHYSFASSNKEFADAWRSRKVYAVNHLSFPFFFTICYCLSTSLHYAANT